MAHSFRPLRTPLSVALLAAPFWLAPSSFAQTNDRGDLFPTVLLPKTVRGAEIPTFFGNHLTKIATWYGRNPDEFRDLCNREHSLRADRVGRLHYVCSALVPDPAKTGIAGRTVQSGAAASSLFPLAQTFRLHSKPGLTKVIYLDFDGNTTSGTYWNQDYNNGARIVTPRFSEDGLTAFTDWELADIQEIWQHVAEDYAPFNVDVTTEHPGLDGLRKSNSSDKAFGIHVCIGGSCYDWFGDGAGGVAYLNSFTWNSDTPCFVFSDELWYGYPKYTAEAISHEVGHTLSLSHDGQGKKEYYAGHGNWAPIMGVGYDRDVTQWSKGEYNYPTNKEDDMSKISAIVGYRADTHGDSIINATFLTSSHPAVTEFIERRGDADLFGFHTGSGQITFSATPKDPSPNLDVQLSLYNAEGDLVTYTSPYTMGATLTTTLPQGTYYVCCEGVGAGDPRTSYSDYGSRGQFTLSGSLITPTSQPPVAVLDSSAPISGRAPIAINFSSLGSADPDGTIAGYSWDFGDGTTSTEAMPVHTYAAAGNYTVSLVVKDNSGLSSAPDTLTIAVQKPKNLRVSNIGLALSSGTKGYKVTAKVTILDHAGMAKPGVTVTGAWSGLVSGNATATTSTSGKASFSSEWTQDHGTITFTVTSVSLSGFSYLSNQNVETQDSLDTP